MIYWLGIGGNLGDRQGQLTRAVRFLSTLGPVSLASHAYETDPVGLPPGSPPFLNAVVRLDSALAPRQLLEALKRHERAAGRDISGSHRASRPIDLDILLAEDAILDEPGLTVPHPEMHRRRFVLAPLAEVAPELVHPLLKRSMAELLRALPDRERVAPTEWTPGE